MAEFLKTKRIAYELEELICTANKYVCIFTFNVGIDEIFMERLAAASKRGVRIICVFGVEPNKYQSLSVLAKLPNCSVYFKPYMHAKFFYNESRLIISTMNLSDASERKNFEIGLLFSKEENQMIFDQIRKEAKEIVDSAETWNRRSSTNEKTNHQGYCIRCKQNLPYNRSKPFCFVCYDEWSYWENDLYVERFCHCCGKEKNAISFAYPECTECFKKNISYNPGIGVKH